MNLKRRFEKMSDRNILCLEENKQKVLELFREGNFDYIDAANEVVEGEFFRFIDAKGYLESFAATYPTPRVKKEVPTWFYLAGNLSMRLHGVHAFHAFPYVVRCGGMLNAFGAKLGKKTIHPETEDVTLRCEGFNKKNAFDRQTPCDQDSLRKFARDTGVEKLTRWFNHDVPREFKKHHVFENTGCFIGDASFIFVPDNPAYENSVLMLFDEHDHPTAPEKLDGMSKAAAARCKWRRCYKLVSLLYTDAERTFSLRVAARLVPGNEHECPILYDMVDQFVASVGVGVIKRLILDRGFLDGERIAHCKRKHGIDILIPPRKNMDIYHDALGILKRLGVKFQEHVVQRRESIDAPSLPNAPLCIRKRESARQKTIAAKKAKASPPDPKDVLVRTEVAGMNDFRSWSSCSVPLSVIFNREVYADGHENIWMLLDTRRITESDGPGARRNEYSMRTEIEEGHRQLKCFWDLTSFTSRAFSLVLNQIIFVLLTFNLLQLFVRKEIGKERKELPRRSRPRQLDRLLVTAAVIIIYCGNYFATLTPLEYTEVLLTLSETARKKVLAKTRRLRRVDPKERLPARPP